MKELLQYEVGPNGLIDGQMRFAALEDLTASAWVALARKTFVASERRPCVVCGKYQSLTHAHHVVPLAIQASRNRFAVNHEHEWLCPSHHAAVHVYIVAGRGTVSGSASRSVIEIASDLPVEELRAVMAIAEKAHQ